MSKVSQEDLRGTESKLTEVEEIYGVESDEYETEKHNFDKLLQQYSSQFTLTSSVTFPPPGSKDKEFEVYFGKCTIDGQTGSVFCRVRCEGVDSHQWIDIDTGLPLESKFSVYVVQAFRYL